MTTRKRTRKKTAFVPRFLFATAVAGAGVIPLCVSACSGQIQGQGTGAGLDVPDAMGGDVAIVEFRDDVAILAFDGGDVAEAAFGADVAILGFDVAEAAFRDDVAIPAFDGSVADGAFGGDGDAAVNRFGDGAFSVADAAFDVGGNSAVDADGGGGQG